METKGSKRVAGLVDIASYVIDTGTANAYAVALNPAITAYTAGLKICFKTINANSGSSTLSVNGLATKTIKKAVSTNLASGDILDDQIIEVIYDGTNFQLITRAEPAALSTSGVGTSPAASQTDAVTHSLGKTPTIIRIYGIGTFTSNNSATPTTMSIGTWNSTGNRCVYQGYNTAAITTTQASGTSTTYAIRLDTGANSFITGVIQNVGATTFDIVWTETGTATAQNYLWEAE